MRGISASWKEDLMAEGGWKRSRDALQRPVISKNSKKKVFSVFQELISIRAAGEDQKV